MKQKNMKIGAAGLFFVFGLLFFILLMRFLYIQVTGVAGGEVLAAKIEKKYEKVQVLEAKRGSIVDRKGEVIAEDVSSYTLVAILSETVTPKNSKNPQHVVDEKETARQLAKYIEMDEKEIYERLMNKDLFQVEFGSAGKELSQAKKLEIEKLELPGITFKRTNKRFYPNGVFASHVIGYVETNEKGEEVVGKLGIERYLNDDLHSENGKITFDSDTKGFMLPNSDQQVVPPQNGDKVALTLDSKIQTFLEDAMNKVQQQYEPEEIIAIVSNPKTGEILAMGQRPTFNPTTREGIENTWRNLLVEETYEPGSTIKVFTLAAAVQEGVFNPNATYTSGSYKIPGSKPLGDHSGIPRGKTLTFLEGVQRSSNVAFAHIAMDQLGEERYREYLTKFGFDSKTGIDLPNEALGTISYKYKRDKVVTAIGQGTTITPIQQIQAVSAIANNGQMMRPYILKSVSDADTNKELKTMKPKVVGQPISEETAKQVREYLSTVVTAKNGTGRKYALEGYDVAGKTGTAQISTIGGGYLEGKNNYLFSFLGMAPKDDPELVMYVAVKQPKLGETKVGSDVVSEIFKPVMQNSLQYLNIKPSKVNKLSTKEIKDYTNLSIDAVKKEFENEGMDVIQLGSEKRIKDQAPKEGTRLIQGEKTILLTDGKMEMPNLKGWSLRDVMKLANVAKIELKVNGSGYVTKQSIKAGKVIKEGDALTIQLKEPSEIAK